MQNVKFYVIIQSVVSILVVIPIALFVFEKKTGNNLIMEEFINYFHYYWDLYPSSSKSCQKFPNALLLYIKISSKYVG